MEWHHNVGTTTTPHQSALLQIQLGSGIGIGRQRTDLQDDNKNTTNQYKEEQLPDPKLRPVNNTRVSIKFLRRTASSPLHSA